MSVALLSITEAAARLQAGSLSASALIEAVLAQIAANEAEINAYITLLPDAARAAASQASPGPLAGIPIAVKDNIETAGVLTTGGSIILANHCPAADAPAWARLRAAGAVLVGKANLQEFGLGPTTLNPHYGPTHNPWDRARIAGGSSGGSAAAVVCGMALAALGTDAGGSVRIPASLCGLVGLKQTHGLVPVRGGIAFGNVTVDHIGPLTRSVADAALLLQLMVGPDATDPTSVTAAPVDYVQAAASGAQRPDLRGLRVGVPASYYFEPADGEMVAVVRAAIDHLGQLGATVVEISIPDHDQLATAMAALAVEGVAFHQRWMRARLHDYGEDVQVRLLANQLITGVDYARAMRIRRLLRERYAAALSQVDLLAAPTVPVPAPTIAEARTGSIMVGGTVADVGVLARNTRLANLTGLPAITVPCGLAQGLPVGLMLMGRAFDDAQVLRVAAAYEATTDWHQRQPPGLRIAAVSA